MEPVRVELLGPEEFESWVRAASAAWERGDTERTHDTLEAALAEVRRLGYL